MTDLQTYGHPALQALNATFSKEQAETLLALLAAVGGSDWDSLVGKPATFPPTIGTTADTAMAGNTTIPAAATWASLPGKPAVIGAGADAAAARTAIGAGTGNSNLAIGTTASTAAAGNHTHTISNVSGLEARLSDIEDRLEALEPEA